MADKHANFGITTVTTIPTPAVSGTTLVVNDGTVFPAVSFNATIWPANVQPTSSNAEIVRVTAISGNTLTITRAQESSTARAIVVGDQIGNTITVKALTDIEAGGIGIAAQAANDLLYASSATQLGRIAAAASSTLITSAGSVPSLSQTLPSAVQANITSLGTITSGVWNGTAVPVANGGTGLTTLTDKNVILGAGTAAPTFVAPGTSGNVLTSNGTTWASSAASSIASANVQIFTTTGANTWTKPASPKVTEVILIGAGGGGGSGRRGAAGGNRYSGGGGGGGGFSRHVFSSTILGVTETVTVGAGGAAGAAVAVDNTDGNAGGAGGTTSFGTWLQATGGSGGGGGTAAQGSAGTNGIGNLSEGLSGAGGGTGVGTAGNGPAAGSRLGACGGGAGGGFDAGNTAQAGGAGGGHTATTSALGRTLAGGAGGTASGGAGGNGTAPNANEAIGGAGGGGGGNGGAGAGGTGGNGGLYGGGAGSGGASVNGNNSGAGGAGANGIAIVITYF